MTNMNTLEREILEKFQQLQPEAKHRVRALIEEAIASESEHNTFDYAAWFHDVELLRQQINTTPIDVVGTLRDIRDGEDE
jgi:hypothetical protein